MGDAAPDAERADGDVGRRGEFDPERAETPWLEVLQSDSNRQCADFESGLFDSLGLIDTSETCLSRVIPRVDSPRFGSGQRHL